MIKPDFWTDAGLTECSLSARLLFIGTWTFADDNGNIELCAKQLKMQIFPGDDICIEKLLNELIKTGHLIPYSVDNKNYLNIKNFKKHQIINRPSPPRCPEYAESLKLTDYSLSTHAEVKEVKGSKRSKTEKNYASVFTDAFVCFWKVYPRRIGKQVASEAFEKVIRSFPKEDVIRSAQEYANRCRIEKIDEQFIMHPSTFLHKCRWQDYCFEEVAVAEK